MRFVSRAYPWLMLKRRTLLSRGKVALLRAAGARIGKGTYLDEGVRIDSPERVELGSRVCVERGVYLKTPESEGVGVVVRVGNGSFLGAGVEIDAVVEVSIGHSCLLAPRVFITDHNHKFAPRHAIHGQGAESMAVKIGNDVWLGTGVTILPGVTIGDGAVVGAGSVVTRSVGEGKVAAGVPARVIGSREDSARRRGWT